MPKNIAVNIGDLIGGKYEVIGVLGSGGMATVYKVKNNKTNQFCALKMILPQWTAKSEIVQRFINETQIAAKLGKHPHIVDILDADEDKNRGVPFLVMEFLEGETLQTKIEQKSIDPEQALILLKQIGDALSHSHRFGIIHRDLKPGNIFIARDYRNHSSAKVLDFGIAKVLQSESDHTVTNIGTPFYAAPEQMGPTIRRIAAKHNISISAEISPATDVWSLGFIAFEMFTLSKPGHFWEATTVSDLPLQMAERLTTHVSASERAGEAARHLPRGFDVWFARCTHFDATKRFSTVDEAIKALLHPTEFTNDKIEPRTDFLGRLATFVPSDHRQNSEKNEPTNTNSPSISTTSHPTIRGHFNFKNTIFIGSAISLVAIFLGILFLKEPKKLISSTRSDASVTSPLAQNYEQTPATASAVAASSSNILLKVAPSEDSANGKVNTEFEINMQVYAKTSSNTFEKGKISALKKGKALVGDNEISVEDLTPATPPTNLDWQEKDILIFEPSPGKVITVGIVQRVRVDGQLTVKFWDGKQYVEVIFSPPSTIKPGHLPLSAALPVRASWTKSLAEEVERAEELAMERKRIKCLADTACKKSIEAEQKEKECLENPECVKKRKDAAAAAAAAAAKAQERLKACLEACGQNFVCRHECGILNRCSSHPGRSTAEAP